MVITPFAVRKDTSKWTFVLLLMARSVDILQEMLGICRKNAYLLVKQNKIHSARVGRSYKIPKLCVVEYLIDQNRQFGGMRLSNSLAPSLQNTSESSKLMMPKQRTFGCEQKGASL